jgi:hypothetical protein
MRKLAKLYFNIISLIFYGELKNFKLKTIIQNLC